MEQLADLISESRLADAKEWIRRLERKNRWQLYSDEEELAIIVSSIVVMPDNVAIINLIDESKVRRKLKRYSAAKDALR